MDNDTPTTPLLMDRFNDATTEITYILMLCCAASRGGEISAEDVILAMLCESVAPQGASDLDGAMAKLTSNAHIASVLLHNNILRETLEEAANLALSSKETPLRDIQNLLRLGRVVRKAIKNEGMPVDALKEYLSQVEHIANCSPDNPVIDEVTWMWSAQVCRLHRPDWGGCYHLCTTIGEVIVSTIGLDVDEEGKQPFETAVFRAPLKTLKVLQENPSDHSVQNISILTPSDPIETHTTNTLGNAEMKHILVCKIWAKREGERKALEQ